MNVKFFSRLERDSKLSALEERADALQDGSAQFEKRAASLKNKFWLENLKSMIAMGVVGLILVGMIYWNFFHQPAQPQMYYPPPPPPQAPAAAPAGESGGDGAGGGSEAASDGGEGFNLWRSIRNAQLSKGSLSLQRKANEINIERTCDCHQNICFPLLH